MTCVHKVTHTETWQLQEWDIHTQHGYNYVANLTS